MSTLFESLSQLEQDQGKALHQVKRRPEPKDTGAWLRQKGLLFALIALTIAFIGLAVYSHVQGKRLEALILSQDADLSRQLGQMLRVSRRMMDEIAETREMDETMTDRIDRLSMELSRRIDRFSVELKTEVRSRREAALRQSEWMDEYTTFVQTQMEERFSDFSQRIASVEASQEASMNAPVIPLISATTRADTGYQEI